MDQIQIYLYCTVLEVWWIASKLNWNFFVFLRSSVCYSPSYYMIITWLTLWENSFRRVLSSNLQARSFAPVYPTLNYFSAIKHFSTVSAISMTIAKWQEIYDNPNNPFFQNYVFENSFFPYFISRKHCFCAKLALYLISDLFMKPSFISLLNHVEIIATNLTQKTPLFRSIQYAPTFIHKK